MSQIQKSRYEKYIGLAYATLTVSETGLDYYQQKMNVRVASWATKQLKTYDLRKLEIPSKLIKRHEVKLSSSWLSKTKFYTTALAN